MNSTLPSAEDLDAVAAEHAAALAIAVCYCNDVRCLTCGARIAHAVITGSGTGFLSRPANEPENGQEK